MNQNQNITYTPTTTTSLCTHSEHNPPAMRRGWDASPGTHRCPACGYSVTFTIGRPA